MQSTSFNLKSALTAAIFFLMAASCQRQGLDDADDIDDYRGDYLPSLADGKTFVPSIHISSSLAGKYAEALRQRIGKSVAGAAEADVVALGMAEYSSIKSSASSSNAEEPLYIVFEPSAELVEELGIEMSTPQDSVLCIAFKKDYPGCCTARKPAGGHEVNDCLNGLVSWVNSVEAFSESASPDNPLSYVYNVMDHTFHDKLDEAITHVALSKVDSLHGKVTINTRIDVTPLHGFTESFEGTGMDYYLVSSCVSIENAGMYSGNFTSRHGGVLARICGFYLRSYSYTIEFLDSGGRGIGTFVEVPTPETAIGSSNYTTGWSFTASGDITGGTTPAATLNTGLSATSSTTRAISDCDMINRHRTSSVNYDFTINNLPHHTGTASISSPPGISVSTANLYTQWIWAIPTGDGDTSTKYKIRFRQTKLEYGANYVYSSAADFHTKKYLLKEDSFTSYLPMPNRVPTGKFCLTNSVDCTYLTNISIKSVATGKTYDNNGQYAYDKTWSQYLPVGEYELTCEIKGKDNVSRAYRYADRIVISTGTETKLSTGYNRFETTK